MTDDRWILAVDPGHGGNSIGAQGHGLREKDITLAVAEHARGMRPIMGSHVLTTTRKADITKWYIRRRNDLCDADPARTMVVSLHCDSAEDSARRGATAFCAAGDALGATFARRIMSRSPDQLRYRGRPVVPTEDTYPRVMSLQRLWQPYSCVVYEMGFLTNRSDAWLLSRPDVQQYIAMCVVNAALDTIDIMSRNIMRRDRKD